MSLDLEDSVCSAIRLEDTMRSPWGLYHSSLTGSPMAGSKVRERVMKWRDYDEHDSLLHQQHQEAGFNHLYLEIIAVYYGHSFKVCVSLWTYFPVSQKRADQ